MTGEGERPRRAVRLRERSAGALPGVRHLATARCRDRAACKPAEPTDGVRAARPGQSAPGAAARAARPTVRPRSSSSTRRWSATRRTRPSRWRSPKATRRAATARPTSPSSISRCRSGLSWRNDPVNFESYPPFFIAHEIAHQWWGQAVGWKNYHEQWLSEGFAQYFAALYAERKLAPAVAEHGPAADARHGDRRSPPQGPIYLGYRLGHIQGDARIFRSVVYNKSRDGAAHAAAAIGDEAFFAGLRDFYTDWQYRKAGTDDFIEGRWRRPADRDLSRFFDAWIFGERIPSVSFSHRIDGTTPGPSARAAGGRVDVPVTVRSPTGRPAPRRQSGRPRR